MIRLVVVVALQIVSENPYLGRRVDNRAKLRRSSDHQILLTTIHSVGSVFLILRLTGWVFERFGGDLLFDFDGARAFVGDWEVCLTAGVFLRFRIFARRSSASSEELELELLDSSLITSFNGFSVTVAAGRGFCAFFGTLPQVHQLFNSPL